MKKLFVRSTLATVLSFSLFAAPITAKAGFLIEPYFSYMLSGEVDDGTNTDDYSGTSIGARLGFTTLGFMYGIDYSMGSNTSEDSSGDQSIDTTDMGLFVGFEFPVLVRVWLNYLVSADADSEITGSTSDLELSGSGYTLGVGYTGFPFISVNFEMFNRTYDDCSFTGVTDCKANVLSNEDITASGYALSISVPLP